MHVASTALELDTHIVYTWSGSYKNNLSRLLYYAGRMENRSNIETSQHTKDSQGDGLKALTRKKRKKKKLGARGRACSSPTSQEKLITRPAPSRPVASKFVSL